MKLRHVILGACILITSCGVPDSGEFREIPNRELPFDLGLPPTTTTTTSPASTTPINGPMVNLFLITASSIVRSSRIFDAEPTPESAISRLAEEGMFLSDFGVVRSALPSNFEFDITLEKGVASFNTTTSFLTDVPPFDQTLAVAQIVLTLTSLPGIGQVRFTVNGRPQSVPRGDGALTSPGGEVTFDDYAGLLIN